MLNNFKLQKINILVSTSVLARGLDVPSIKTVINFDCSKTAEDHIHRIGRTGRYNDKDGVAYTLLLSKEKRESAMLLKLFEQSNQIVSKDLLSLA